MPTSALTDTPNKRWDKYRDDFARSLTILEKELENIWQTIGLDDKQVERRVSRVFEVLTEITSEMLTQERSFLNTLESDITAHETRLKTLYIDLHEPSKELELPKTLLAKEQELIREVASLESRKNKAMLEWTRLKMTQKKLSEKLGIIVSDIEITGIPTIYQLEKLTSNIILLEKDYKTREKHFNSLLDSIKAMVEVLDAKIPENIEIMFQNKEILVHKNLNKISHYNDSLHKEYNEKKIIIDRLWTSIELLWKLLDIDVTECKNFKISHQKYSDTIIRSLKNEESRLKAIRLDSLAIYITKLKEKLICMWGKCRFGAQKREQFLKVYENGINEEVLTAHEEALLSAQTYYDENSKILHLIERWDEYWELFRKLELGNYGVDKYNNRGGALLKEERLRRTLWKDLPRLEQEIDDLVEEFSKTHETTFLIDDMSFKEYTGIQQEALRSEKDERKRIRLISRSKYETPDKRFNNTVLSSRMNSTLTRSRICATDTCNRTRKLDQTIRLTPIKRRSSFVWPDEDSFVARRCNIKENIISKEHAVLKESNVHNISTNVAVLVPVITSDKIKNAEKSPKSKVPLIHMFKKKNLFEPLVKL